MRPQSFDSLSVRLLSLDGKGYGAYKSIRGGYGDEERQIWIDHVQGDPFAQPSRVRLWLSANAAALPAWAFATYDRRRAAADWLNRRLWQTCRGRRVDYGSGKSGAIEVLKPSQAVLMRTSLRVFADGAVEARVRVGLPAHGRRIAGDQAQRLLVDDVPEIMKESLQVTSADHPSLRDQVETVEDAVSLRGQLKGRDLVAFVPDGAILARRSGVDDSPLCGGAVPFESPESMRVELDRPNAGVITGLGVRRGVTLIVGGGYHGKSTLLRAIETGIYDHVPGDGREAVVCVDDAMKIRAEDGRSVAGVDVSAFIDNLPLKGDTVSFDTRNASGSTSQAAAIVEALQAGASTLLVDEDTSATNFMIRDARMQRLVRDESEPITPFIDRVRQLLEHESVSTVAVVGGVGDYFEVADHVIRLTEYKPEDVTGLAQAIAEEMPSGRQGSSRAWASPAARRITTSSLSPTSRGRRRQVKRSRVDRVQYGDLEVELSAVEQIIEAAQTRAMAEATAWLSDNAPQKMSWAQLCGQLEEELGLFNDTEWPLDALGHRPSGDFSAFRPLELSAFINRLRTLEASTTEPSPGGLT